MNDPKFLTRRHYLWITLGFLIFVIYGSFVPLETRSLSWTEACEKYEKALGRSVSFESRADWLANILLFIPLGFVALAAFSVDRRETSPLLILVVLFGCILLSAGIEFFQLWFPARFTSVNDIVAETLGGLIGIVLWMLAGQRLTNYLRSLWSLQGRGNTTAKWIPGYLILLVVITGMPFDLTLSPTELKQKYRQGRVVISPFTLERSKEAPEGEPLDLVRKAIKNMAYFVPAGVLLAGFRGRATSNPFLILGLGMALASAIEGMQLFIYSRYFDVTDILTGSIAVMLGWCLMRAWQQGKISPTSTRWILLATWIAALIFINWEPFHFVVDSAELSRRRQEVTWIPFKDYYQENYLIAFDTMLEKVVLFAPLGILLPGRMLGVVGTALVLAVGIEGGKLFMPMHPARFSNVILEVIGAGLACLVVAQREYSQGSRL